jgi:hypothetical protein
MKKSLLELIFALLVLQTTSIYAAASVAGKTLKDSNTTDLKNAKLVGDEVINTPYGKIELQHTFMTDESSQKLFDAIDFQRASQAYI